MVTSIELLGSYQIHCYKYRVTEHWSDTWLQISSYWTLIKYIVTNIELLNTKQFCSYKQTISTVHVTSYSAMHTTFFPIKIFLTADKTDCLVLHSSWAETCQFPISPFTPKPIIKRTTHQSLQLHGLLLNFRYPNFSVGANKQIHHCERHNKGNSEWMQLKLPHNRLTNHKFTRSVQEGGSILTNALFTKPTEYRLDGRGLTPVSNSHFSCFSHPRKSSTSEDTRDYCRG